MINQTNNNQPNFKGFIIKSNAIKGQGKPVYTAIKGENAHIVDYFEKSSNKLQTKVLDYNKDVNEQLAEVENFDKGVVLNVAKKVAKGVDKLFYQASEAFNNSANVNVVTKGPNVKITDGTKLKPLKTEFSKTEGGIKQLIAYVPDEEIAKIKKPHQAKGVFEANYHNHDQGKRKKNYIDSKPDGRWINPNNV